jgi:hypothetical protein
MFTVMRIPEYVSGLDWKDITPDHAKPLLFFNNIEEARKARDLLIAFTTRPPGPMQASLAHHFVLGDLA